MITMFASPLSAQVETSSMSKKRKRKALKALAQTQTPPPRPPWVERPSWQICALTLLVLLAYANSLHGAFLYDDAAIRGDPSVVGTGFGWRIFLPGQARPLTFLTFHWNYLAAGTDPVSWHVVSVLLHAANTVLLLFVARRHLSSGTAFIAAALYGLHPLQTEVVAYIYQRSTLLATFFALISFLLFLKERYAWSVGAFALSLLSKEETIALPIFLLLYEVIYRRRRPRVAYYAVTLAIVGLAAGRAFYVWNRSRGAPTIGYHTEGVSALSFVLTEPRVVWRYLRLILCPVGQNVDHDVALSSSLLSPPSTLPALLGLAALVGVLIWLAWRGNQPAFWGLGFFVLLAPTSSIVPVKDLMFEHRVYFPLIGVVIAAAALLARMPRRALIPAAGLILTALLVATIVRNRVWHDRKSLWTDAAEKSPYKARPYRALGMVWVTENPPLARQYLEHALALTPDDPRIQTGLGNVSLATGDGPGALQHFERAIAEGGETPVHLNNLGMAYHVLGQLDQAVDNYHRALERDPCMWKARRNLAVALAAQGKKLEASAASQLPPGCHLLPEQAQRLEEVQDAMR